ncbi:MAG TPA: hypothetical protein VIG41_10895, partial [Micrococcaceae bacterium]
LRSWGTPPASPLLTVPMPPLQINRKLRVLIFRTGTAVPRPGAPAVVVVHAPPSSSTPRRRRPRPAVER